jgi:hypothetical protein
MNIIISLATLLILYMVWDSIKSLIKSNKQNGKH